MANPWDNDPMVEDLCMSAERGDQNDVLRLLRGDADPNAHGADGNSAVHVACKYDKADALRVLLSNGGSATSKNAEGKAPLEIAKEFSAQHATAVLKEFLDD